VPHNNRCLLVSSSLNLYHDNAQLIGLGMILIVDRPNRYSSFQITRETDFQKHKYNTVYRYVTSNSFTFVTSFVTTAKNGA